MRRLGLALSLPLAVLLACQAVQPLTQPHSAPSAITHFEASGCNGEHDTISLTGEHIDAYPGWPPKAQPEHIVLHYDNGTSIWGKPSYGSPDCSEFATCRRATFILNPSWNQCTPQGPDYEVLTLDGNPVLHSSLLQIIDPATMKTTYLGFGCGRAFA